MKKALNLTVPEPCHEKWSKMTPDGKGKFCASCNKTVVDFSTFTDKELAEFFKKLKGAICGSFYEDQLNRPIAIPVENNNSFLSKALLGTALLAGVATHSEGQVKNQPMPMGQVPIPNPPAHTTKAKDTNGVTIKGKVINHKTKEPISYLVVTLANSDSLAETDTAGMFSLYVPDSLKGKSLTVLCDNHYSYKDYKVVLEPGNYPQDMVISLKRKHHLFRRRHVMGSTIACPSF